jgi:ADP-ribose pyrophosphatase YjhB (NUDIX family)
MQRRISVRAIVFHEGKMLAVRLKKDPEDPEKGTYWCTPGGGLDDGEALHDGLRREMLEETGIEPVIGDLLYVQQFPYYGDREYMEFFFHVTNAADYLNVDLSTTSHGHLEIDEIAFIDAGTSYLLPKFLTEQPLGQRVRDGGATVFSYFNTN